MMHKNEADFWTRIRIRSAAWIVAFVAARIHAPTVVAMALRIAAVHEQNMIENLEVSEDDE